MDSSGNVTLLYSFPSPSGSSSWPYQSGWLIQGVDGNFYGTTCGGGSNGDGTIFQLTVGGAASGAVVNPTSLTFGSVAVNTTSQPQTVTLTNTGTANLSISNIAATTSTPGYNVFYETDTCPGQLGPGSSCSISVTFTPTAFVIFTGNLTITDNASAGSQSVSLSGTGG